MTALILICFTLSKVEAGLLVGPSWTLPTCTLFIEKLNRNVLYFDLQNSNIAETEFSFIYIYDS